MSQPTTVTRGEEVAGHVSPPTTTATKIAVAHVGHHFAGGPSAKSPTSTRALADVSLSIAENEFVALVGPSGCGKTTLLNMIAGLIAPTAGSVTVDDAKPRVGDRAIGYMLARDALLPWRTICQNVALPLELHGVKKAEALERAHDELCKVGLEIAVDSYPAQLSHGMRQRAALARTLVTTPSLLLMDEPFSALDAQTRLQLQDQFLEVWQGTNTTVVMVTHDLGEAIVMADRVVVFSGRPGSVLLDKCIELERPRHAMELQGSDAYHDLFKEIWQVLRSGMVAEDATHE